MRVRYKPWAEDYLKEHPDLVDMDGTHAGRMSDWFDTEQPIYIEIGSGMGQFITTLASKHPEINFVSMEREKSVMYKVLDKTKELNLTNLKMICNDAIELNEYFKDGKFQEYTLISQTLGQRNVMQKDVLHITHSLLYISRFSRTMEKFTLKQTIVVYLHIVLRVCRNLGCILQK